MPSDCDFLEGAATLLPSPPEASVGTGTSSSWDALRSPLSTTIGYPEIFLTEHSFQAEKSNRHLKEGNCVFHYQSMNKTHMGGELSSSHERERSVGTREFKPLHTKTLPSSSFRASLPPLTENFMEDIKTQKRIQRKISKINLGMHQPRASHSSVVLAQGLVQLHPTPFSFGKVSFPQETNHSSFCSSNLNMRNTPAVNASQIKHKFSEEAFGITTFTKLRNDISCSYFKLCNFLSMSLY